MGDSALTGELALAEDGATNFRLPSLAALAVALAAGTSQAGQLAVGAGRADITPPSGFPNWTTKDGAFAGVVSPLYARALVLADGERRLAILQWDLVNTRADGVAKVRRLISEATGIPATDILVNASHDHSAPLAPVLDDRLMPVNEDDAVASRALAINRAWTEKLYVASVSAAKEANASLAPADLEISRASVPEWQFNRRPRRPDGSVSTLFEPPDPFILGEGMTFGPTDPTVTVLAFRSRDKRPLATLFSYPCHAVCVYPYSVAFSADWPGFAEDRVESEVGGRAIFLQGCAGDLVPARRGIEAAKAMGSLVGQRIAAAETVGLRVAVDRLRAASARVSLPWNAAQKAKAGADHGDVEIQAFVLGTVAIVALPGEPMIEISRAIQRRSPYPQTLVLGYSNGSGVIYVGLPGELARGGYETTAESAHGTDECGTILVDSTLALLARMAHGAADR
ncbi:MAG TPA: neutral/alkaline non-lysosomal ceramidase N-terminal domain-containing protein [Opitutaceae bacterium]|jgi:hypothetical protein